MPAQGPCVPVQTHMPASLPARSSAVMGQHVAGYTSVVTNYPVSPSGYALAAADPVTTPPASPQTAATLLSMPQRGCVGGSAGVDAGTATVVNRTAAMTAAAAALVALGGWASHSQALEQQGCTAQDSWLHDKHRELVGEATSAAAQPASLLHWRPRPQLQGPASHCRYTEDAAVCGGLEHHEPGGSPGLQLSASLSRLKQLSGARLVERLTTPPTKSACAADGGTVPQQPVEVSAVVHDVQVIQPQQHQSGDGGNLIQFDSINLNGGKPSAACRYSSATSHVTSVNRCNSCGRSFMAAALERHAHVCSSVFGSRHPTYDAHASRQPERPLRAQPTGLRVGRQAIPTPAAGACVGGGCRDGSSARCTKWQQQSEQLRLAMRASRGVSGGASGVVMQSGGQVVASAGALDNRVPCPHCGRRFAAVTAERHIPKCADIQARPGVLRAGGGRAAYMRSTSGR